MGFLTSIMAPAGKSAISESEFRGEAAWLADTGDFGVSTASGVNISTASVVTLSAVFASARAIAEDVACLPLKAYRRIPGGGKRPAIDDPKRATPYGRMINLYGLVHDYPNREMGSLRFWSLMIWWALIYGNAYAEIVWNDGNAVELKPIHPGQMKTIRTDDGRVSYQHTKQSGQMGENLEARNVLHLMGISDTGFIGYVIPILGRESFGVYMAAERYSASYFGAGATLKGVVTFENDFKTAEARAAYIAQFNAMYNTNKWLLADNGAKVEQLNADPEKAQLTETLKFRIEDVARWFRVPPVIIGHNTATPYANIEPLNQLYWQTGLKPWALRIEEEGNIKLIPAPDEGELFIEHVVESLMWADSKTRTEVQNLRIRGGWGSPNEAREVHNMNPIPGGDQYRIEQNLALLDDDGVPVPANNANNTPPPAAASTEAIKLAMMPALVALSERLITREVNALQDKKAITKDWLDRFYSGHRDWIVLQVGPVVDSVARLSGSDASDVAERFADQHIGESRRRIEAGEAPSAWLTDRPAWMARHLSDGACDA